MVPDLVSIAVLVAFAEDNRRVVGRHLVRLKQIEPGPLGEVGDLIDPVRRLRAAKAWSRSTLTASVRSV